MFNPTSNNLPPIQISVQEENTIFETNKAIKVLDLNNSDTVQTCLQSLRNAKHVMKAVIQKNSGHPQVQGLNNDIAMFKQLKEAIQIKDLTKINEMKNRAALLESVFENLKLEDMGANSDISPEQFKDITKLVIQNLISQKIKLTDHIKMMSQMLPSECVVSVVSGLLEFLNSTEAQEILSPEELQAFWELNPQKETIKTIEDFILNEIQIVPQLLPDLARLASSNDLIKLTEKCLACLCDNRQNSMCQQLFAIQKEDFKKLFEVFFADAKENSRSITDKMLLLANSFDHLELISSSYSNEKLDLAKELFSSLNKNACESANKKCEGASDIMSKNIDGFLSTFITRQFHEWGKCMWLDKMTGEMHFEESKPSTGENWERVYLEFKCVDAKWTASVNRDQNPNNVPFPQSPKRTAVLVTFKESINNLIDKLNIQVKDGLPDLLAAHLNALHMETIARILEDQHI